MITQTQDDRQDKMENILAEIRRDFVDDLPNALDAIMTSHREGDMDALFQAVHRLKGAAAVCQFDDITLLSENYCEAIRERHQDQLDECQAQLVMACGQLGI
jgi:HPt (histidine-containing phosphotransfer) domain-containing protein